MRRKLVRLWSNFAKYGLVEAIAQSQLLHYNLF